MSNKINFAWPTTSESAVVYEFFKSETDRLHDRLTGKLIVIFGAGIRGCELMWILKKNGLTKIIFCDNNADKQGNVINEFDIISLQEALLLKEDKVFIITPENSDSMKRQLIEAGLSESTDFYSFEISLYDNYVTEYLRPVKNHLLVMGDCAFSHISFDDTNTASLADILKSRLGEDRCKVMAMHGLGQRAHYNVAKSLLKKPERPLLLLLLVMECLTPKAHLMPRTQHPELFRQLLRVAFEPKGEIAEYQKLAEERFNRFQVESFAASKTEGEQSEKLFMRMNYLFHIKEDTEGVEYLKKTLQLFNEEDIPVAFYIPPVNYVLGERLFGKDFTHRYYENFEKLYGFLDNANLKYSVVDASLQLSMDEFAATNTIDETSRYAGRIKLIEYILNSPQIKSVFGVQG